METKNGSSSHFRTQWRNYSFQNALFLLTILVILFCSHIVSGKSDNEEVITVTLGDYSALQAIKQDLVDLRGVLRTWKGRDGVCSGGWVGIKCDQGRVIAIQLPWKGLGGKISSKFGNLHSLRRISLHDNLLSGVIPQSLWLLPNLRGLYLFNNRLSGSIPPSVTPSLQNLDLSNNQLNGTIPSIVSNSSKILYRFNLSYNAFSGSIPPSFALLPSLAFLALEHNNLSGPIPDTWKFGQLTSLTVDHNFLSGNIPTSLSKMSNLEKINLGHNHINGIIPNEFANLSKLQLLDLSNNVINGSFPSISTSNLSVLILDNNQLNGQIFDIVGNFSSLTQLGLSHNNFSGEIPESIGHLKNLDSLNVSYNSLSGSVPSSLSKKFNSTSFVGNLQLCGYSITTPCHTPSISPSPSSSEPHPLNHQKHEKNRKLSTKDIILIAAGALLLVLLLLCCLLLCCLIRKKSAARSKSKNTKTDVAMAVPPVAGAEVVESGETGGKLVHFSGPFVFTADDLLCATAEIMGKSTYGTSYKATLEDGNMVAVKRLREKVTKPQKEFETEAAELGKIRHDNVLALRAYYLGPKGEKLLVFDYMPHGSLASFLHARGPESVINWPTRLNIIVGITKGLVFLHSQESIVHGNLTSSNVLLDEQKNPAIADVGLSRLMTNAANTNVVATAGTLGYRAPELSKLKNANTKTDVYSLGVIILELLTGKSPSEATDGLDLPQWVASIFKNEWTNEVFDLELMGDPANVGGDELLNTLKLAMHCVDPSPEERPEAVQVLEKLEEIKPELVQSSDDAAVAATAGVPLKSD
ncbi:inflorescence meristem receptor-like kinase 2 [Artemisia annua]|uniref:Inflorescence meristem receptor-like kinase 2 n=1 Tax=Artemisia annua TaxID=35608 RepID=A0A2U1NM25_ARTAN|nr:inflorescence meristem receptor-like kinase 2 [Artemisia annua]